MWTIRAFKNPAGIGANQARALGLFIAGSALSRAGTGSDTAGSGWAQALGVGLGSGSGFPLFGYEPVGLNNFQVKANSKLTLT